MVFSNTKELEGKTKYAQDLQKVADEPAMGQTDVDELNKRVREANARQTNNSIILCMKPYLYRNIQSWHVSWLAIYSGYLYIFFQIKQLSAEINTLIEKRMVRNDPIDDKLSLFRQQVSCKLVD